MICAPWAGIKNPDMRMDKKIHCNANFAAKRLPCPLDWNRFIDIFTICLPNYTRYFLPAKNRNYSTSYLVGSIVPRFLTQVLLLPLCAISCLGTCWHWVAMKSCIFGPCQYAHNENVLSPHFSPGCPVIQSFSHSPTGVSDLRGADTPVRTIC